MAYMESKENREREVVALTAEAVLDIYDVARWLKISKRQAERLGIPCLYLGTRTRRYLGKTVLEYLEKKIG
jgi:hypothetical protein